MTVSVSSRRPVLSVMRVRVMVDELREKRVGARGTVGTPELEGSTVLTV